ncbi:MAG: NAD(P)-dependent oxidoreductase [Glaciecola sp.]|jgi:3-hydroxyisobutyrate dehydrogenase|uniref:NAD(P)-dependent oxidoreductase n=1 Tax=Glaciecola sp. HTCC2999 TaxID=455436 RepID=UPI0000E116F9|nr:NAD(P)-dependent oxidoreductase [Glaciecola sp. HTCC2999]
MTQQVAFLGLGVMGFPMARHLHQTGFSTHVYNRTIDKAQHWINEQNLDSSHLHVQVASAVKYANVVCMCLGNDNDVRSVFYGENGVLENMPSGSVLIDHTTGSQTLALELHMACAQKGIGFIDAPVSGGQAGAENGQLTIMCGGNEAIYANVETILNAYSRHHQLLGSAGSGQLAKMMNQICIAGIVQGLSEAIHFGEHAGLDTQSVINVISKGAAQSWQMDNRAATMIKGEYDFGFAVDWMRKDLGIALDAARQNGSTLPLTALVDQFYADVQQSGGGRLDTSSLLTRLSTK